MATNFLQFCTSSANGLALALAACASGIDCVAGVGRIYTRLVEGRCKLCFGGLLLLPFHYLPQSTMGRLLLSFPMDKQRHQCLRIQITLQNIQQISLSALLVDVVDNAPPPWCQSGTLPLDSLPLGKHVADWQASKLISTGCQISDQFRFEVHQFSYPHCFPQCQFFDLIKH